MAKPSKKKAIDTLENHHEATYRSGAAARLSGVPVETLRVWERRYGITDPGRSEQGQRQYSFEDVRRLGLIKQLVDGGNPIGTVAALDVPQLLALMDAATGITVMQTRSKLITQSAIRIVLVGAHLLDTLRHSNEVPSHLQLLQSSSNLTQAAAQLQDVLADIVIIELGEIADPNRQIRLIKKTQQACQAKAVLVLYRFSSSDAIRQLRQAGCYLARMSNDVQEVENHCHAALAQAQLTMARTAQQALKKTTKLSPTEIKRQQQIPERLLTDDALALIAKSASAIHCECPRHLVDLLHMLTSFERYSAQCENRNDEDASLHHDLHHTAAHARASLEQALLRVAQVEGILIN
jgi:DNA-binding transcriptional MerR regulator